MEELWSKILEKLKESLNESAYNIWFQKIQLKMMDDRALTLLVPNTTYKETIETRYSQLLGNAIEDVLGSSREILIEIEPLADRVAETQAVYHVDGPIQPKLIPEDDGTAVYTPSHKKEEPQPIASADTSNLNPRYTFDTFVTGKSNQFAHAVALSVAKAPGSAHNPLFLYGGAGLGKTHLMHAIGHYILKENPAMRVLYVSSEKFMNEMIAAIAAGKNNNQKFREKYRMIDVLLVDDIQFIAGKDGTQEEFFHTFEDLHNSQKQIILSSDRPPKELEKLEERLRSRFAWGIITDVQPPDLETRIAILKKKAQIEHLDVPNDVIVYIASRIESNIRELEGALTRTATYSSLITNAPITVETATEALKDIFPPSKEKEITVEVIQEVVASYFRLNVDDLRSKKRTQQVAVPRQIAMYLSCKLTTLSLPAIGDLFARHYSTVIYARDELEKECHTESKLSQTIAKLIARLEKL